MGTFSTTRRSALTPPRPATSLRLAWATAASSATFRPGSALRPASSTSWFRTRASIPSDQRPRAWQLASATSPRQSWLPDSVPRQQCPGARLPGPARPCCRASSFAGHGAVAACSATPLRRLRRGWRPLAGRGRSSASTTRLPGTAAPFPSPPSSVPRDSAQRTPTAWRAGVPARPAWWLASTACATAQSASPGAAPLCPREGASPRPRLRR
mmetsp:Transcript_6001/g.25178  ORF Transcript_6001/g.25178 Transcript_6001/m.25178 type:complete len:212 (+) Transcript_6001:383-1018(+)